MLFTKHYINKVVSGSLLIVLLFVHSIKLLHSHPYAQLSSGAVSEKGSFDKKSNSHISKITVDCEICSYQLTKDADNSVFLPGSDLIAVQSNFNSSLITSGIFSFLSSYESRGPPDRIV